jgi:hypothetical protein
VTVTMGIPFGEIALRRSTCRRENSGSPERAVVELRLKLRQTSGCSVRSV